MMTLDPLTNEPPPVVSAVSVSATSANAMPGEKRGLLRTGCAQFKRLTQIGLPRRFPIVQFPNAPLIIAFLAGQVAERMHGQGHADASAISYLTLTVWAYEELVHGVNWFRHLLGLAYVISTAVHLALALHR
jgi:hypothetical protein